MRIFLISLLSGISFMPAVFAEDIISEIRIEGNNKVKEEKILSALHLKVGEKYSAEKLRDGIKRLYELDYFKDINFKVEEKEGVRIVCVVIERPGLEVEFLGNKYQNTDEIREELKKAGEKAELFYSPEAADWYRQEIIRIYKNWGYHFVEVTSEERLEPANERVTLIFHIKEGEIVKVRKIEISGLKAYKPETLKKMMETKAARFPRDGIFREGDFEKDLETILSFYRNNGYLKAGIVKKEIIPDPAEKNLYVSIHLQLSEGLAYKVGDVTVRGARFLSEKEIKDKMGFKTGTLAREETYQRDIDNLGGYYAEKGYLETRIRPEIKFEDDKALAHLVLHLDEGELLYLDQVIINGRKITREEVIRREVALREGEILSGLKIVETRNNLQKLGYLGRIDIGLEPSPKKNRRNLIISVDDPGEARIFDVGYYYYTNLYGSTFYMKAKEKNLFGRGQTLELNGELGKKKTEYRAIFEEPWLFNRRTSLRLETYDQGTDQGYFHLRQRGVVTTLGKPLGKFTHGYIGYAYEKSKVYSLNSNNEEVPAPSEEVKSHYSKLFLGTEKDSRDDPFFPKKGVLHRFQVSTGGRYLGGQADYVKATGELSNFREFLGKSVVFMRVRGGLASKLKSGDLVPIYERFYVGGAGTVRGYDYAALGSRFGNLAMLVANLETRYLVMKNVYAAFFYDIGGGWKKAGDINLKDLEQGVGAGIVFNSPLAEVRVDYAYPLSDKSKGDQVYLSFGGEF